MKIQILLVLAILLPSCAVGSPTTHGCTSVAEVKGNPKACTDRPIRMRAYLVSTRHGEYLVDTPRGENVLLVEFSESVSHRKSTEALLEKLGRANLGKPHARIFGVFEGRIKLSGVKGRPKFEVFSEVQ